MAKVDGAHIKISIHALREEGDIWLVCAFIAVVRFLSTPSARRATKAARLTSRATRISIHALREEGDKCITRNSRRGS